MAGATQYFRSIKDAVTSIFEGLTVTMSWMFRRPMTIQYPDKLEQPIKDTLPEGYRGPVEVDLAYCTGCNMCARECPIDCIVIDVRKDAETNERMIYRFDVDLAKCMFCGLCTEACKFDAIRQTKEFEFSQVHVENLTARYVQTPVPVAKPKAEGRTPRPLGAPFQEVMPGTFAPAPELVDPPPPPKPAKKAAAPKKAAPATAPESAPAATGAAETGETP